MCQGWSAVTEESNFSLMCPETLFISHENANFLFSVVRMVQGEAKTPKIRWCCRANFAFLPALKIGTFRGKWTLEWMFKTSLCARPALYFLINSKLAFLCMILNDAKRELQKNVWFRVENSAKNNFLPLCLKPVQPENFSFSVPFSIITHEHSKKIRFSTSSKHKEWG